MVYMYELLIVGCGGLGRMVGEVALATGKWSGVRFLDDAVRGEAVVGKCVDYTELTGKYPEAVAAFGENRLRLAWAEKLLAAGYRVPSVVHPTAIVSPSAQLGEGCLVLQGLDTPWITLRCGDRDWARVSAQGFPTVVVWSPDNAGAFVCVEPWQGLPSDSAAGYELARRPCILRLAPGRAYAYTLYLEAL